MVEAAQAFPKLGHEGSTTEGSNSGVEKHNLVEA